jgi:hypothetical protein
VNRYLNITILLLLFATPGAFSQEYKVRGYVYDSSRNYPLQAVSVMSTSGKGTLTNADGQYELEVFEKDSVWFSYLGKPTVKFPVAKMQNPLEFDVSLHVNVPTLREVKVKPKNYRFDSIQNRKDYAKVFNFQKPKLATVTPSYGGAVGFDLDEIINMFRFRRNRSMLSFQQRLLMEEEDKFIDHRFNKALVRRLTLLDGSELDNFMQLYRPSYSFTRFAGEYEFQLYIKNAAGRFRRGLEKESELE